jgi:sugar phosphate isomerase/epimerase
MVMVSRDNKIMKVNDGFTNLYGYDKLEIQGSPEIYDMNHVGKLLKDHGVGCWGSVTLMMEERNLLANDPGQRERSIQYVKDIITMVKELEGEMVSVVPSTVGMSRLTTTGSWPLLSQ